MMEASVQFSVEMDTVYVLIQQLVYHCLELQLLGRCSVTEEEAIESCRKSNCIQHYINNYYVSIHSCTM